MANCKPRVTVRCSRCEYVHMVLDYTDQYVFLPETLKSWASLECTECHRVGLELYIDTVAPHTESEVGNG